jgi:3-dehydroquinate dehydratase I
MIRGDGLVNVTKLLNLELGKCPRVVGTVCQPATLDAGWTLPTIPCDIVEVRLDLFATRPSDWLQRAAGLQAAGIPVILTVRSKDEGGRWDGSESDRERMLATALDALPTIDVEWTSQIKEVLCRQGAALNKPVIVSHHNFQATPELSYLRDVVDGILALGETIPKISTFVNRQEDIDTLHALLGLYARRLPICVIGMGPLGTPTRLGFPLAGSALTYGYLDRAVAPGQLAAGVLREALRSPASASPDADKHGLKRCG